MYTLNDMTRFRYGVCPGKHSTGRKKERTIVPKYRKKETADLKSPKQQNCKCRRLGLIEPVYGR